ncbi:RidA family protein [Subtercola sp. Z020]|uniref:RidA family protein n=1 Tax=Subtercola sp. Z020 TaxID=2080582 RepID=UPI000CE7E841|nr:RidA family protein [Subtercola sp. Z020]PPF77680.1 RidA family protein [Subtercola sp. Z020]
MTSTPIAVDPPQLYRSPAFAQGMIVPEGRLLFVGGQNGVDENGALVDGLEAQVALAIRNVLAVLSEAGSGPEYVAKLTIHLAVGVDAGAAFAASQSVWGRHRTAVTVLAVNPARPGALVEVEAVATVPA